MTGEPETMTTEQIHERFGVEPATLRLWVKKRVVKAHRLPHTRLLLIDVRSFRDLLQKHATIQN